MAETGGIPDEVAAAACYWGGAITGLYFLYAVNYRTNRLVRFHAWQSIYLSAVAVILYGLFLGFLFVLPLEYASVVLFVMLALSVVLVFAWFAAVYGASRRRRWALPIVGSLARRRIERN